MSARLSNILLILFLLSPVAQVAGQQQSGWKLTTADLVQRSVRWIGASEQGVQIAEKSGPRTIPWDNFVEIRRPSVVSPATRPAELSVQLRNGDSLIGQPRGLTGENLNWTSALLGDFVLPLRQIVSIVRGEQSDGTAAGMAGQTEDQARLTNGDLVKGIVTDITGKALKMQVNGQEVDIPIDSLANLYLAATDGATISAQRRLQLAFDDGSILSVSALTTKGDVIFLTLAPGAERSVPVSRMRLLRQLNGPVVWLSSLHPIEAVQHSDFGMPWPARMNRSVTGDPIRFGSNTYGHGIGVHAYSRLRFRIPDGYRTFRTQYAIDGNGALANVIVRVYLDDKPIYEQRDVKARSLSPVLEWPLKEAKVLTLEVDFGENGGVEDRFNWIEPALLKRTAASTRPAAQ
jgi:hypothetical protein